ncbi:MAG: ribonuclease E/G, partial [Terriglobia bacterium]
MPKRMLIDASHPEETRVVVLDGQKVEEFDFEAASRRPLKGNIYLAKVTRVEPSLQAAFVEYGGNRQGFLAFSEIHPDYYQIPMADRQALIEQQQADVRRRAEEEFEPVETGTAVVSDEQLEASDEHDDASNSATDEAGSDGDASANPDGDEEIFDNKAGSDEEEDDSDDDDSPEELAESNHHDDAQDDGTEMSADAESDAEMPSDEDHAPSSGNEELPGDPHSDDPSEPDAAVD